MAGKASRDKGVRGELEIVKMINDNLGLSVKRNLKQYQEGSHGDLDKMVGPYLIEVKNVDSLSGMKSWWAQASDAAMKVGAVPCLAYKASRKWRFRVPHPIAWATGEEWGRAIEFTQDVSPECFFMIVRELT